MPRDHNIINLIHQLNLQSHCRLSIKIATFTQKKPLHAGPGLVFLHQQDLSMKISFFFQVIWYYIDIYSALGDLFLLQPWNEVIGMKKKIKYRVVMLSNFVPLPRRPAELCGCIEAYCSCFHKYPTVWMHVLCTKPSRIHNKHMHIIHAHAGASASEPLHINYLLTVGTEGDWKCSHLPQCTKRFTNFVHVYIHWGDTKRQKGRSFVLPSLDMSSVFG